MSNYRSSLIDFQYIIAKLNWEIYHVGTLFITFKERAILIWHLSVLLTGIQQKNPFTSLGHPIVRAFLSAHRANNLVNSYWCSLLLFFVLKALFKNKMNCIHSLKTVSEKSHYKPNKVFGNIYKSYRCCTGFRLF